MAKWQKFEGPWSELFAEAQSASSWSPSTRTGPWSR